MPGEKRFSIWKISDGEYGGRGMKKEAVLGLGRDDGLLDSVTRDSGSGRK